MLVYLHNELFFKVTDLHVQLKYKSQTLDVAWGKRAAKGYSIKPFTYILKNTLHDTVGGGIGMGNTCISKADSCQCMTKTTTIL